MKTKKASFSVLITIYSAILAVIVAILFGLAVAVSVFSNARPRIMGWLMIILFFGLSFIINYLVLRFLFSYISKLTKAIKQVAEGDFSIRLASHRFNPLDATFSDFNQMVSELDSTKIMKEDFISQFSHEFKTPITSINGFANLLLKKNLDKEKRVEYLKIIAEESKRLTELAKQIMILNNLENKKIITNQKTVEIDEELRKNVISVLPWIEKKKLDYKLDLQKVKYYTDPELLKAVLLNLLSNSIKFVPVGGTVYVSCMEKDGQPKIVIGNNGPEIAEADRKKIFEEFYQAELTEKQVGLGLGLTIAKQALKLIGGEIFVKSTYKKVKGTFFEVVLK